MADASVSNDVGIESESNFEIGHVLLCDIVGYSKLFVDAQEEAIQELTKTVKRTVEFQKAEAAGKLICLSTGDGLALAFLTKSDAPVKCALEIAAALKFLPNIPLRIGIHSGQVRIVTDVNERSNIAGAAINIAQRVMDCGDAGHILISKHLAEDLEHSKKWHPYLHNLGEVEVKHGEKLSIVNLYTDQVGNPAIPKKFKIRKRKKLTTFLTVPVVLVLILAISGIILYRTKNVQIIPAKSIAVLPFENLSTAKENGFFAEGVQDQILTDLAAISDLKVISRTSVMQYTQQEKRNIPEIGKQLGVANILEGSVQREGNEVRINAQLINTRNDTHVWAQTYDRNLNDVFKVQSEISQTIADQLKATISPQEKAQINTAPTTDLSAYDLYVQANNLYTAFFLAENPKTLLQAVDLLNEAVKKDPKYLQAWALLTLSNGYLYFSGVDTSESRLEAVKKDVEATNNINPNAGETHYAEGIYYYTLRDYNKATAEFGIARKLEPNNSQILTTLAAIQRREGNWNEALSNYEHAKELDPQNLFLLTQLFLTYNQTRKYPEAKTILDRMLEISGNDPSVLYVSAGTLEVDWKANIQSYHNTVAEIIEKTPNTFPDIMDPTYQICDRTSNGFSNLLKYYPKEGIAINGASVPYEYWLGFVLRIQGKTAEASAAFLKARSQVENTLKSNPDSGPNLGLLGAIDAALGNKDQAISEGRRACELLPISKDAVDGPFVAQYLAQIYAWSGEPDLAIRQIEEIEKYPGPLTYGQLKLNPTWDPLRGNPKFEAAVNSLAPNR